MRAAPASNLQRYTAIEAVGMDYLIVGLVAFLASGLTLYRIPHIRRYG